MILLVCILPGFNHILFREWALIQVDMSHCKFIVHNRVIQMHESSVLDNFLNVFSVAQNKIPSETDVVFQ